jgi:hypothetical protein
VSLKLRPRLVTLLMMITATASVGACATTRGSASTPDRTGDLAAAQALFERNISAIQAKDRDAYLGCYRADDTLIRVGPEGAKMGFAELATGTSTAPEDWPTRLDAEDMQLRWLGPGYVYGLYRYRVTIAGKTTEGVSERVFVRGPQGWKIQVTTAFERCPAP